MKIHGRKENGLWAVSITINGRTRCGFGTTIRRALLAGYRLEVVK